MMIIGDGVLRHGVGGVDGWETTRRELPLLVLYLFVLYFATFVVDSIWYLCRWQYMHGWSDGMKDERSEKVDT